MNIISSIGMKKVYEYATQNLGISSLILVESCGMAAYNILKDKSYKSYTIVCSPSKIGAIGLVLTKHLHADGKFVYVNVVGDLDKSCDDFKANYSIIKKLGINVRFFNNISVDTEILKSQLQRTDAFVDSLFGIELEKKLEGDIDALIDSINENKKTVISLDIPSGLEADNGFTFGSPIIADQTITFYKLKNALVDRTDICGEVVVVSIGIPQDLNI